MSKDKSVESIFVYLDPMEVADASVFIEDIKLLYFTDDNTEWIRKDAKKYKLTITVEEVV